MISQNHRQLITILIDRAAQLFGVDAEQIIGARRHAICVEARHAVIYVLRKGGFTSSEVCDFFERDRATILHAVESISRRTTQVKTKSDRELCVAIRELEETLRQLEATIGRTESDHGQKDQTTSAIEELQGRSKAVRQLLMDCVDKINALESEVTRLLARRAIRAYRK